MIVMGLIDIVDKNDNVIGQKEFWDVVASFDTDSPYFSRAISIFVFNSENKLVLQKRSKKVQMPGKWDYSIGGNINAGDGYEKTAIIEAKEELGIDVNPKDLKLVKILYPLRPLGWKFTAFYICHHNGPFVYNDEVDELRALSIEEIKKELEKNPDNYTPWFREVFKLYLRWLSETKTKNS